MIRKILRVIAVATIGLLSLVLIAGAISAMVNRSLPTASTDSGRLGSAEIARVGEFAHLQSQLGNRVWPGFGDQPIPVVLYNEDVVFLVGLPQPADGWRTVPDGRPVGGPWTRSDELDSDSQPVLTQQIPASGTTPQAFTVRVGDRLAASMTTLDWMRIGLRQQMRSDLPPVISGVFPYSLFIDQLVSSSDQYISLIAHEAFHAYQGTVAPERLAEAEASLHEQDTYPWEDESLTAAWQAELDLLAEALNAQTPGETDELATKFLAARQNRRLAANLTPGQIEFEQQREWLEGLARYVELAIWRAAAEDADYRPIGAVADDPDFDAYAGYDRRWKREISQLRRMANDPGEGRFYYSGMAIGMMLDRLDPDWKARVLEPNVSLEDLLTAAISASD